ncbi:MAG TPA: hypothetical protein VHV51_08965 [Polyangiaceae bacterium]|nr:hypothetical protein [Polyangiaceae bacterium]
MPAGQLSSALTSAAGEDDAAGDITGDRDGDGDGDAGAATDVLSGVWARGFAASCFAQPAPTSNAKPPSNAA